ncbi:MAG: hypothetical protein RLZZ106_30 [Cyanobacteriota bacterium]|jgi:hypothetical protein
MGRPSSLRRNAAVCAGLLALMAAAIGPQDARADYSSWGMSTQEKQIYDYGPGGSNGTTKQGSVLDSANPIDLMNKIRRGTAMDDATPPGDAVDAALKELNAAQTPGPSSQVKSP